MTVENGGSIYDLLFLFSVNRRRLGHHPVQHALRTIWRALWRVYQSNPLGRAARNVRQHYDHPADFYALWLDQRMNYSCAYFTHPEEFSRQRSSISCDTSRPSSSSNRA